MDMLDGRPGDALAKVNRIRRRVGMPEFTSVTMDDINNERRVELAMEKTTYWDLYRNGTAEDVMCGEENPLFKIMIIEDEDGEKSYSTAVVNGRNNNIRYFAPYQYFWPISWNDVRYHGVEQNPEWREM